MADYLLFRLYGAMAAWGEHAIGEHRQSASHPGKAAVMGLLAAALGIKRDEEQKLLALSGAYGMAVRVEAVGERVRDYHTTQVPSQQRKVEYRTRREELTRDPDKLNTILSKRDYRLDSSCSVAIWLADDSAAYSLEQIEAGLSEPHFVLYLGRKSCPLGLPLEAKLVSGADSLQQAFESTVWLGDQFLQGLPKFNHSPRYFWEALDDEAAGMQAEMRFTRHDQLLSRKRWQFSPREESYSSGGGQS